MLSENSQKELKPQRKIRRGSSFPCLFILCMETLSTMISKCVQSVALPQIHIFPRAPTIPRATIEETFHLASILRKYTEVSRQRINFQKLELSFSINVPTTKKMSS